MNDLAIPDASTIRPSSTFHAPKHRAPGKLWPANGAHIGADSHTIQFEVILPSFAMVEKLNGIMEQNSTVLLHSTWQTLFQAERTIYASLETFEVQEALPSYVRVSFSMNLLGTPASLQPRHQVSSRQLENWRMLPGVTAVGLPATAFVPSTGTTETRGLTTVVKTPSWANDASYVPDDVRLGEITYELNVHDTVVVADAVGTYHGTNYLNLCSMVERDGRIGMQFPDGGNNNRNATIDLANSLAAQLLGDKTFVASVYRDTISTSGTFVATRNLGSSGGGWGFYHNTGGALILDVNNGTTTETRTTANGVIKAGQWQRVILSYNSSTRVATYYVDGVKYTQTAFTGTHTAGSYVKLGGEDNNPETNNGHEFPFIGIMRDVAFYNVAVDDATAALLTAGEMPLTPLAHYPLNPWTQGIWRNAVKLYDGDFWVENDRVYSANHAFTRNAWIASDQYRLRIEWVTGSADYGRLLWYNIAGTLLEKFSLGNLKNLYILTVTDDYVAIRTDTGYVIEMARGKDPVIIPPTGTLTYVSAASASGDQVPASGNNYVAIPGTTNYVAANRDFKIASGTRNIQRVNGADTDMRYLLTTTTARSTELLKKLG